VSGVSPAPETSYRALLAVPWLPRILAAMIIARIAQSMVSIAIVLFTLIEYRSPALTGIVTLAATLPGILVSPIAGALLDRHGRMRLVRLDYVVALVALALMAILSLLDALPAWLLILITAVSSLTAILSQTGLRSLFPIIVPEHLWERVNAVDSNGYVIATIVGPPIAAALVGLFGGPVALMVIGVAFGIAAAVLVGGPDPAGTVETTGRILSDAWAGVRYTWNNPTLRGLGFSVTFGNLAHGMITIVLPLIILERFDLGPVVVGLVFAASGISGVGSAFAFGRMDTRGKEWSLLVWPMVALVPTIGILLVALAQASIWIGLALVFTEMLIVGLLIGPMDIALFTVRQRRTDPAWTGRAFAVSMAFNYLGVPIGAAIGGLLAASSIEAAIIILGIGGATASALAAAFLVPREDRSVAPAVAGNGRQPAG